MILRVYVLFMMGWWCNQVLYGFPTEHVCLILLSGKVTNLKNDPTKIKYLSTFNWWNQTCLIPPQTSLHFRLPFYCFKWSTLSHIPQQRGEFIALTPTTPCDKIYTSASPGLSENSITTSPSNPLFTPSNNTHYSPLYTLLIIPTLLVEKHI